MVSPAGLTQGVPVIAKPDGWRETVSISYGSGSNGNGRTPLYARGYEYCRAFWPDDSVQDANNPPKFYADYDIQHILVVPTPPQNYPLEWLAYLQPTLLDSVNQTNFWTTYTPNLILYGTLLEMTPFLKDDTRIPTWQNYWQLELASLNTQDLAKIMDRLTQRNAA